MRYLRLFGWMLILLPVAGLSVCTQGRVPPPNERAADAELSAAAASAGGIASAADEWQRVRVGFIGAGSYLPETAAALAGARAAAAEVGPQLRMHVAVENRTAGEASSLLQNAALRELFVSGTDGVLIHPVDPAAAADLLTLLQRQRMQVVTFGTAQQMAGISGGVADDEAAIGEALAKEADTFINRLSVQRSGKVAVLAGGEGQAPYNERLKALRNALESLPVCSLYGVFYNRPDFGGALEVLNTVTQRERNETLNLWVSLGNWPLAGHHAKLPQQRGLLGIVVAGGLPAMLPYLQRGEVLSLVSPDYYARGYEAMRIALEALDKDEAAGNTGATARAEPRQSAALLETASASAAADAEKRTLAGSVQPPRFIQIPPRVIRKETFEAYARQWAAWLSQPM